MSKSNAKKNATYAAAERLVAILKHPADEIEGEALVRLNSAINTLMMM